jgi:magnesium-transporting ATPase (P-type)
MLIHQLPLDAAFATLRSTAAGLSRADAAARHLEFGPNRIERLARVCLPRRFAAQFTHFFVALLWVAAVLAYVADRQMPGQGMATLAIATVAVIIVNGAFSFWQEYRAEETMAALQRLLPHQVRKRDGAVIVIPSEELVPGDVVLLSAGDDVPADCRLLEASGGRVNNATVTGEARAVSRDAAVCTDDDLLRSRNVLLAGTSLTTGEAQALVFATGMHTVFGGIARLGAEPPDRAVMQRPPRRRDDRLLTAGLLARAYLFLGACQAIASMAAFFFVLAGAGWEWGRCCQPTARPIGRRRPPA